MSKVYISFHAEINPATSEHLMGAITTQVNNGVNEVYLMFSTQGGNVNYGISLYNSLRALPINLITHNVGVVDSIGNVIFLAGERRYACIYSRFMFHGVTMPSGTNVNLDEKALKEKLGNVQNDQQLMTSIIGDRTDIDPDKINDFFLEAEFLSSTDALNYGIIHEVREVNATAGVPIIQLVFNR